MNLKRATTAQKQLKSAFESTQNAPYYKGQIADVNRLQEELEEATRQVEELTKRRDLIIDLKINVPFPDKPGSAFEKAGFSDELAKELAALGYDYTPGKEVTTKKSGGRVGGGSAGAAAPTDDTASLQSRISLLEQIAPIQAKINQAELAGDQLLMMRLEGEKARLELIAQGEDAVRSMNTEEGKSLQARINQLEQTAQLVETEQQLAVLREQQRLAVEGVLVPIEDEIELLNAKLNGNEKYIQQLQDIEALAKSIAQARGASAPTAEDTAKATGLIQKRDELKGQVEEFKKMEETVKKISGTIASEFTSAVSSILDGTKSVDEAFSEMLTNIGKSFVDMALKIIEQQMAMIINGLIMKALGISMPGASALPAGVLDWAKS